MPLTRFQRLAIAAAAGVALVADAMWMLNGEPDAKARKKIAVPDAVIAQRFADFRGGPMVGGADEGDFARAGYIWAMQKRPTDAINCPISLHFNAAASNGYPTFVMLIQTGAVIARRARHTTSGRLVCWCVPRKCARLAGVAMRRPDDFGSAARMRPSRVGLGCQNLRRASAGVTLIPGPIFIWLWAFPVTSELP